MKISKSSAKCLRQRSSCAFKVYSSLSQTSLRVRDIQPWALAARPHCKPRSTQLSTLCGIVKWVSAVAVSSIKWWWWCRRQRHTGGLRSQVGELVWRSAVTRRCPTFSRWTDELSRNNFMMTAPWILSLYIFFINISTPYRGFFPTLQLNGSFHVRCGLERTFLPST